METNQCKNYFSPYTNPDYGFCMNNGCDRRDTCEISIAYLDETIVDENCINFIPEAEMGYPFCDNLDCKYTFVCILSANMDERPFWETFNKLQAKALRRNALAFQTAGATRLFVRKVE